MLGAFTTGPDGDGVDWRLGALYEALAAHVLVPVHHAVLGGWRPAPADPATAARYAVTIHDIVLPPGHSAEGAWEIELRVDDRPVAATTLHSSSHTHRLDAAWSVPVAVPSTDTHLAGRDLSLRVSSPHGTTFTGTTALPSSCPQPGHYATFALHQHRGSANGAIVHYDLWPLDAATQLPAHPPESWDAGSRADYAERLGQALGERLSALFPAAIASRTSRPAITPIAP
jgi:hypothetical protein